MPAPGGACAVNRERHLMRFAIKPMAALTASAVALRVLMEEAVVVDTPEVLEETALAEVAVVVVSSVLWLYREVVP